MIEEQLAQVILHTLAQHASQIDEREYECRLEQLQHSVPQCNMHQGGFILQCDARVDDLFAEIGKVGIHHRSQQDRDEEARDPFPMRPKQSQDALEHGRR